MAEEGSEGVGEEGTAGAEGEGQSTVLTGDDAAADGTEGQASGDGGQEGEQDGQVDGEGDGEGSGEGESQVPETYEFTMPDGMELDQALADAATPVFKELNLTQEQADKLTGLIAEQRQNEAQASQDAFAKQLDDWATELKNDSDVGGEKFDENAAIARTAVDKLGSDALKELFDSTGIGNHPEMFKFALAVGKLLSEDQPGSGTGGAGDQAIEDRMYPKEVVSA